jgi:hypothetical protein
VAFLATAASFMLLASSRSAPIAIFAPAGAPGAGAARRWPPDGSARPAAGGEASPRSIGQRGASTYNKFMSRRGGGRRPAVPAAIDAAHANADACSQRGLRSSRYAPVVSLLAARPAGIISVKAPSRRTTNNCVVYRRNSSLHAPLMRLY